MSIDIEELKRKALAARPGPWYYQEEGITGGVYAPARTAEDLAEWPIFGGDYCEGYLPRHDPNVQFVIEANPETVLALIERLEAAERDALKYRALLASAGDRKPESLAKLLPPDSLALYIRPDTIHQFEASPDVQMTAHVLVSERHGKFDLIHLVAYLLDAAIAKGKA